MALKFYEQSMNCGQRLQPNEAYREQQQAYISWQWDNTSALTTVEEQDGFGPLTFHEVEVWMNKVIGTTSTFMKNGEDFRQLIFEKIDRPISRGIYYRFENNYWLGDFINPAQGLVADIAVRRCNNFLRMVDSKNGAIFTIPCVIDYDATSPSQQVSSYVITPNNHLTVIVQANNDTMRLFKYNTRFLLNGRAFKLLAFQNALYKAYDELEPKVLYLDLYLDELHAEDDLENQLAFNGDYVYAVSIDGTDMELTQGSTGALVSTVTLNGQEVNRPVVWASKNDTVVTIDNKGRYQIIGDVGTKSTITAMLEGNEEVVASIEITIVDQEAIVPVVTLTPTFDNIRQYQTIKFGVEVGYGGKTVVPRTVKVNLGDGLTETKYLKVVAEGDNRFALTCKQMVKESQMLNVEVSNIDPTFEAQATFSVNCVSMMG